MTIMNPEGPTRRTMLLTGAAWGAFLSIARLAAAPDFAFAQDAAPAGEPFAPKDVLKLAEDLASKDFERPVLEAPEPFNALNAEQYRDIRFRTEQALWQSERIGVEVHLLPRGWIYETPVEIRVVEDGQARRLTADSRMFSFGQKIPSAPEAAPFAFSGFRLVGPFNRADQMDEFAVFQGASYFRALGQGQNYGLSARGLAVNTAQPAGEEFPIFRAFWIEKPRSIGTGVVVHALLDSPSVTGAYRFTIEQSRTTIMQVDAVLYPRRSLKHFGIAPLTSMFLKGSAQRRVNGDLRPAVHNSEGLAILNGRGERLWRPLTNPRTLQTSAFIDKNPRGFGLMQRDRAFTSYDDLNARFETRPSLWIEPRGNWGEGYVELIEIPSEEEIHDNIVAYWTPSVPLERGTPFPVSYRLTWSDGAPIPPAASSVARTAVGRLRKDNQFRFLVDFDGPALAGTAEMPTADLTVSTGQVLRTSVQPHPVIGGVRVSFDFDTGGAEMSEMRLALKRGDTFISETWLYRWTA
jgi:glucans biosynthesis protein